MEAVEQMGRERPGDRRALQSVSVQFFANGVVYASFIPELPEIRDRVGHLDRRARARPHARQHLGADREPR